MKHYDAIVLGVGGMGSATCYSLARRGASVLGIEQLWPAHHYGSSHGKSRLIRQAYFEHPDYVPLLKRSYLLWEEIGNEVGEMLLNRTGLLTMGSCIKSKVLNGCEVSSRLHGIPTERLSRAEIALRYPSIQLPDDFIGVFEPGAGYLPVETCVKHFIDRSAAHGAVLHFKEPVLRWSAEADHVEVVTENDTYSASHLVITAGPWLGFVLEELGLKLTLKRAPQFWFDAPEALSKERGFPCFAFDLQHSFFYGFPSMEGNGVKMADHSARETITNPFFLDCNIHPEDIEPVAQCLEAFLPEVKRDPVEASVCIYSLTDDEHFIIDKHPHYANVSFAGGFSGHGFKFAPVVGEILADLATTGETPLPISFLRMKGRPGLIQQVTEPKK